MSTKNKKFNKINFYFSNKIQIETLDGFHILQDHIGTRYPKPWNDHDYIVTFNMYYVENKNKILIGTVKILNKDIKDTSKYFSSHGTSQTSASYLINDCLKSNKIVSLGTDLDYYRKIEATLKESARDFLKKYAMQVIFKIKLKNMKSGTDLCHPYFVIAP